VTGTAALPPRPRLGPLPFVLAVAVVLSAWALPWNFEAIASWQGFGEALGRLGSYLAAFAAPDLSPAMLQRCGALALETLAVALLGTAIGLVCAYPLALGACRAVVIGEEPAPWLLRGARRAVLEACRLVLDALRGVPDFAWAIVLANVTGVNAITGVLAIAISVAGIFGKVLSEQWDNIDPQRYAALRSTGASRLATFAYGVQPLAGRAMLSFVLMRTECAVRNASVIGVVGGGGLGAALWDHYTDGDWPGVASVLLTLIAVTAGTDVLANLLRHRLRVDPNHPRAARALDRHTGTRRRVQVLCAVLAILGAAAFWLREPFWSVVTDLRRVEWSYVRPFTLGLFTPDLGADTLWAATKQCTVPLAIGVLATLLATAAAALLTFPASVAFQLESHRFTGEQLPPVRRGLRWALVALARGLALLLRGIPEVAWVILLAVFFRIGVTPCVFAVALHSTGVLHRVFTETLDNVPYRRLEQVSGACRPQVFAYGALPRAMPDWRTYAFFQFEVNVRIGVALGMVGAGGLGHFFQINLDWREYGNAATFLWAMVLLTVAIDRLSRWLQMRRRRC
jgi:phosphonate transport system permease protein